MKARTLLDSLMSSDEWAVKGFTAAKTPAERVCWAFRHYASHVPELQIDITPSRQDPHLVTLDSIEVDEEARGQRVGAKAMQSLCGLADQHGVSIDLEVSDSHDIGTANWYARNGFEWQDGFMLRRPQA